MGDWIPARSTPHPAAQAIATGGHYEFAKPAYANGFFIGADQGPIVITFDGTVATATNGLQIDPGNKGGSSGLIPVTVNGQLSVYNKWTGTTNVTVAWVENTDDLG